LKRQLSELTEQASIVAKKHQSEVDDLYGLLQQSNQTAKELEEEKKRWSNEVQRLQREIALLESGDSGAAEHLMEKSISPAGQRQVEESGLS
jgi:RNA polymerase-interacting CarD/CdnL/TRCF family regulator